MDFKRTMKEVKELIESWLTDELVKGYFEDEEAANVEMLKTIKSHLKSKAIILTEKELTEIKSKAYNKGHSDAY